MIEREMTNDAATGTGAPSRRDEEAPGAVFRVLVVCDPETDISRLLADVSVAADGAVEEVAATGPKEGLRYLGSGRFDIAFVELKIGDTSGMDLIRNAGGRLCATPIVLMSGIAGADLEQAGLDAGAVDFLDLSDATPALIRRILRYSSFSHRMTRRLMVDEQRHRNRAESAFAATEEKTRFLAQMSHELRTPLNAILGFSEVVKNEVFGTIEGEGARRYRDYLGDIHASGCHLLSLINDLLDMSKIEAGRMEIAPSDEALSDIAADVARMTRPQAAEKNIALTLDLPAADATVRADRRLFTQALLNIVANAIKFTPAGGSVTIALRYEGPNLVLSVADTGCGIRAADIRRVLEPFQQAGDPAAAAAGTGLGLPLARSIMELHGGGLEIASEFGQGTTVSIWLPQAPEAAAAA